MGTEEKAASFGFPGEGALPCAKTRLADRDAVKINCFINTIVASASGRSRKMGSTGCASHSDRSILL